MEKVISILLTVTLILLTTQCKKNCFKSDRCKLQPEVGPCMAVTTKYYYDKKEKKCKQFSWGGCAGVVPFDTLEECENQCNCK